MGDLLRLLLLLRQNRFGPQGKRAILRCGKGLMTCGSGSSERWSLFGRVGKRAVALDWARLVGKRAVALDWARQVGKRAVALDLLREVVAGVRRGG